jgi:hypothetical protein
MHSYDKPPFRERQAAQWAESARVIAAISFAVIRVEQMIWHLPVTAK